MKTCIHAQVLGGTVSSSSRLRAFSGTWTLRVMSHPGVLPNHRSENLFCAVKPTPPVRCRVCLGVMDCTTNHIRFLGILARGLKVFPRPPRRALSRRKRVTAVTAAASPTGPVPFRRSSAIPPSPASRSPASTRLAAVSPSVASASLSPPRNHEREQPLPHCRFLSSSGGWQRLAAPRLADGPHASPHHSVFSRAVAACGSKGGNPDTEPFYESVMATTIKTTDASSSNVTGDAVIGTRAATDTMGTYPPSQPSSGAAAGKRKGARKSAAAGAVGLGAGSSEHADSLRGNYSADASPTTNGSFKPQRGGRRRKAVLESGSSSTSDVIDATDVVSSSYESDDEAMTSSIAAGLRAMCTPRGGVRGAVTTTAAATGGSSAVAQRLGSGGGNCSNGSLRAGPRAVAFSTKLPRASAWSDVRQWVVFSDLHVRESSLVTCLEVLRAVREEAGRRQAGVLFLGDFWDRRGALPVEPLNQVLQELSSWRCPVLMLVGNHDQVDLGGLQHSLTPLELACPHVHVFEEPTRWHGALWLPYRRETWVLEQAMSQAEAEAEVAAADGRTLGTGPLNAIFLHADVRTARTNQWRQAEEGLEPTAFPPHLPVYSGHYHLPHTVRGTNITYIGSPYQVSMNEASETKRLLVLEAPSWRIIEEITLAIGPRHLRLSGSAACDQLRQLAEAATAASTATAEEYNGAAVLSPNHDFESQEAAPAAGAAVAPPQLSSSLRRGDRVKLWLSAAEAQDERVVQAMAELERAGVAVEQVLQPEVRPSRVHAAEGLSAAQMVDVYCSGGGGKGDGLSPEAAAAVRSVVSQARDAAGPGGESDGPSGRCVDLELASVRLRGFGPFVEEQVYPLAARGVRVIVGENLDEPGADSNGAGKTSLVTAPLWALTGEVLTRTESGGGGRVPVDVMRNDRCSSCAVKLSGRLNGVAFEVAREVKRGKTSSLTLRLGDEDLTLQDISGTAERIRRLFATDLLRCAAFFGQNDITGLLEANDATLKQKLGLVVDLEIWEAARQLLAAPRKAAAAAAAEEGGRARVLTQQWTRRAEEVEELQRLETEWAEEWRRRLEGQQAVMEERAAQAREAVAQLQLHSCTVRQLVSELHHASSAAEEDLQRWEAELLEAHRTSRRAAELAALSQPVTKPPLPTTQPSPVQQPYQQLQGGEQEAVELLLECQAEEARMQKLLSERQSGSAQALGRLRQFEASLQEYQTAVATAAAAAAAAATPSRPSTAASVTAVAAPPVYTGTMGWVDGPGLQQSVIPNQLQELLQGPGSGANAHGDSLHGGGDDDDGSGSEESTGRVETVVTGRHHHHHDHSTSAILAVCDRCRQPISSELYTANVDRLKRDIAEAKKVHDIAAGQEREAHAAHATAAGRVSEARTALLELQRRRVESDRRAAAEALTAAAAAEREARAAEEAARRAREATWREAEGWLRGLQARVATSSRARGDLLAAAADVERVVSELDKASATWALHATAVGSGSTATLVGTVPVNSRNGVMYSRIGSVRPDSADAIMYTDDMDRLLHGREGSTVEAAAAAVPVAVRFPDELLTTAKQAAAAGRFASLAATRAVGLWREAAAVLEAVRREVYPQSGLLDRARRELADLADQVVRAEAAVTDADLHLAALNDADRALGRSGIPSLVLEDVLAQLQAYTARYLNELCDGFVLELSATKPAAGGSSGRGGAGAGGSREKEEIHKVVKVRNPANGALRQRDVRQLSGGERRRVALALCLGFEELVRRRRRLVCNVMVLDEVLQQLDNTGCELVARVLQDLPHASVLVVGQTNSNVISNFDLTDVVVKEAGASNVRVTT